MSPAELGCWPKMKAARQLPDTHLGYGWFALLLRFGLAFVAIVGAARVNFHDPPWAAALSIGSVVR
jgi:hypothetical protein